MRLILRFSHVRRMGHTDQNLFFCPKNRHRARFSNGLLATYATYVRELKRAPRGETGAAIYSFFGFVKRQALRHVADATNSGRPQNKIELSCISEKPM